MLAVVCIALVQLLQNGRKQSGEGMSERCVCVFVSVLLLQDGCVARAGAEMGRFTVRCMSAV